MLSRRQIKLLDYVIFWHRGQIRKYTNDPYWMHCFNVGSMAASYGIEKGFEIGICHDLVEDTFICLELDLKDYLIKIGYSLVCANFICSSVLELTNEYTSEKYHFLNREQRKKLECRRLSKISHNSQSIKYCDLIDNSKSITIYDKEFSKVYLREKLSILDKMNKGNELLLNKCKKICEKNFFSLSK